MAIADIPEQQLRAAYTRDYVDSQKQKYYQMLGGTSVISRQWRRRVDEIAHLVGSLEEMTLLDLGCGVGTFALEYAKVGNQTIGVDFTREMLAAGEELALEQGIARARFITGQVSLLPFDDDTFDVIVASDIAEHLLPQTLADSLAECLRVLKPGGRLIIHTDPSQFSYLFNHLSTGFVLAVLAWLLPLEGMRRLVTDLDTRVIPKIRQWLGRSRPIDLIHVNLLTVWRLQAVVVAASIPGASFCVERAFTLDIYPEERPWFFRLLHALMPSSMRSIAERNIYIVARKQIEVR